MKRAYALALVAAFVGCSSEDELGRQHARLGSVGFDVPADWDRTDSARRGVATAEWRPRTNTRKEAITVIRTEMSPAVAKAGPTAIERHLAAAQRSLPQVRASHVKRFTTSSGLEGARVELEFVPPGQQAKYRRIHVVVADGAALVHVLYTAKNSDRAQAAIDLVLANLKHEDA